MTMNRKSRHPLRASPMGATIWEAGMVNVGSFNHQASKKNFMHIHPFFNAILRLRCVGHKFKGDNNMKNKITIILN